MSLQLVNDRRLHNWRTIPKELEVFEKPNVSQSEKSRHFIQFSRKFQNKIYSNKHNMLDITTSVHSGLHENLKHHIEKGIKCNSNDETENVQKIFNTIKKTAASNKCKQYTLVFLYATAYCYKENNTVLIPIIRVEWMENFTVDFLTKTGKKFNSINKLIRSLSLPSSLVCFPKNGKYQYNEDINGIALEFTTIHFYIRPFYERIPLECIILPPLVFGLCSFAGVGILKMWNSCSAIAVNNSWISAVGNSTVGKYIRIILQKLHLSWLSIFITDRIIKSIASSNNVTKRAHTIVTLIFNNLSSFEGLGLLLSLSKPSGDIQNISFKTNDTNIQQTERIFKYKFSSEFDFDKILKYEVETWRSYVGEIIKDAENLMKQNGGNFERKLWFAHCFTQEEICSRYSEEKYSLKEFLKTKNEELGKKEEKTEIFNDENLDDDSIHDLDFIVIYHDDTAKKCVYIFQIEIERLTSKGRVSGENDHWTHVHYDTTKCMLRKFNHENVDYVCVVEDYIETGTVLPWSVLIEQQN